MYECVQETAFSHIDKDQTPAFQTVKFSLSGKESKLFSIDALTSEISVVEPGSVDCEKRCRFEMMVSIFFSSSTFILSY